MAGGRGWLFDYHAEGGTMVLWFLGDDGARVRLEEPFEPTIFLEGADDIVLPCVAAIEAAGDGVGLGWTERIDFWTGAPRRVHAVRLIRVADWRRALDHHADRFPAVQWHQADLMAEQMYGFDRDVFPLMRCRWEDDGAGRLTALVGEDDRWSNDYAAPPLRMAELAVEGVLNGARSRLRSVTLTHEGRATTWDAAGEEMLAGLQRALDDLDPDILLTAGGDAFAFPLLLTVAARIGFPLRLDRDTPPPRPIVTEGRSYFSYGRILYQAPEYALRGRWHLDRHNSFTLSADGMEGLFEVARLARIPMQRVSRRSIGTGISSIQLDHAWREGLLIPWKKTHPEAWKSARQLLQADRGGLVYAPETGVFEDVVELDFVAMYPSIMARFNVSPETVNCPCCRNGRVPGIGYTICERRAGLVSRALAPIIAKRVDYKARRKAARAAGDATAAARWDHRQSALKWMLVSCFGYLGYRNARFGRIEAHEAVSAYSREMLLRAREVCEEHGWRMLHANVDCVWIVKPGFQPGEVPALCDRITADTGLPIALEGIYRWLAFLPSRQIADRPVPTRYFGVFHDGSLKYRGIECRRRDLPPYIRAAQLSLLEQMATAPTLDACRAMVPALLARVATMEEALWRHEVPVADLLLRTALSRDPAEYRGTGRQSLAARQSVAAGLALHAGESMSYLLTALDDPDPDRRVRVAPLLDADTAADPAAYIRLLRRAINTILWPLDVSLDEDDITPPWQRRPRRPTAPVAEQMDLFGGAA
jgi:DNA polymerase-2